MGGLDGVPDADHVGPPLALHVVDGGIDCLAGGAVLQAAVRERSQWLVVVMALAAHAVRPALERGEHAGVTLAASEALLRQPLREVPIRHLVAVRSLESAFGVSGATAGRHLHSVRKSGALAGQDGECEGAQFWSAGRVAMGAGIALPEAVAQDRGLGRIGEAVPALRPGSWPDAGHWLRNRDVDPETLHALTDELAARQAHALNLVDGGNVVVERQPQVDARDELGHLRDNREASARFVALCGVGRSRGAVGR